MYCNIYSESSPITCTIQPLQTASITTVSIWERRYSPAVNLLFLLCFFNMLSPNLGFFKRRHTLKTPNEISVSISISTPKTLATIMRRANTQIIAPSFANLFFLICSFVL